MATTKVVSTGYTDTPISGVTSLSLTRGLVNFGADFKGRIDDPNEVIITNLTSPLGQPETFRWSFSEISDVYKNTSIDPAMKYPIRKGVNLLCQVNDTWKITDTNDATFEALVPVSAHLVLKVPSCEAITAEQVIALVGRLVSGLFDTGSSESTRLKALLRGSLEPSDM